VNTGQWQSESLATENKYSMWNKLKCILRKLTVDDPFDRLPVTEQIIVYSLLLIAILIVMTWRAVK
jgi:hypothetical protein